MRKGHAMLESLKFGKTNPVTDRIKTLGNFVWKIKTPIGHNSKQDKGNSLRK